MNKNKILIGVLIIIIFLTFTYLIYKNSSENKSLEEFRNSQSSYYQDNTDNDFVMDHLYKKNNVLNTKNIFEPVSKGNNYGSHWNGYYTYSDGPNSYYACFLKVNKNILFSLSRINFDIWNNFDAPTDNYYVDEENSQCLPDMLIARGELNQDETIFYLKQVYCSNGNTQPMTDFKFMNVAINDTSINDFYGSYNKENNQSPITLGLNSVQNTIDLERDNKSKLEFGPSAQYLLRTSYNRPINNMSNKIYTNLDACENSSFQDKSKNTLKRCYISDAGLPTPLNTEEETIDNKDFTYNIYGTGCSLPSDIDSNNLCPTDRNKTCFLPVKSTDGDQIQNVGSEDNPYTRCDTSFSVDIKNQTSMSIPLYKTIANQLDICQIFEPMYGGNNINACIIMYVDNLMNVETLGYDFFGPSKDQSYLKTSYDIMFPFMNKNILNNYRNNLDEIALKATNCLETNNVVQNFTSLIESCKNKYSKVEDQYNKMMNNINSKRADVKKNSKENFLENIYKNMSSIEKNLQNRISNRSHQLIMPTVWSMDFEQPKDLTNACSFILSTSSFYQKENQFVKYAEFDSFNSRTTMNLYKGSNKQKLVLENPFVLDEIRGESTTNNGISNNYILLSGNLRTYNPKKYLVPGQGISTSPFGKEIYLQNRVNPNGKWLILGMTLTNNLSESTSSLMNNNTLLKTLNAIKEKISS